jgi:hypothetical protein
MLPINRTTKLTLEKLIATIKIKEDLKSLMGNPNNICILIDRNKFEISLRGINLHLL